jgi:probable selenium-dependent hydroxylase accessory protein YqeC
MDLWDAAGLTADSFVSVVGAGGKTTSVLTLAEQARQRGFATLITTTTKMRPPCLPLRLTQVDADLDGVLKAGFERDRLQAAGSGVSDEGKLLSLEPALLCSLQSPDVIICEADGAAGRSLKIHRPGEPVVPPCTTHFLVVVGLDALGRPIAEAAHPSALSAQHFGTSEAAPIEEHQIFDALLEGAGYKPEGARLILVLNKADTEERLEIGRRIAGEARVLEPSAHVLLTSHGEVVEGTEPLVSERPYTRP